LGSDPLLGDVYQIQGATPSENYVDDDEANNGTVTFTSPSGTSSITVGMFLLNQSVNGVNNYAVRWAAGNAGKANGSAWIPGTWTWSMSYTDHQSTPYTCTETGSVNVASTWDAGNGFLRSYNNTPNLVTDGNNQLFFPIGFDWYDPYYNAAAGTTVFNEPEIPALSYVTVNGTSVTYVSGVQFSTTAEPSNITPQIYLCPSMPICTPYFNITVNSGTSVTLPSNGGTYSTPIPAYLGFTRDISGGDFSHALGTNPTTQVLAAQFYAAWGENFNRLSTGNIGSPYINGNYLGTGFNQYYWSTGAAAQGGVQAIDSWFAATHAVGIHLMWGGDWGAQPCASFSCTATTRSNLQNFYAYVSARWGAFYDVLELENEQQNVPQNWVDDVGEVIVTGVPGIAGGNPADPYGHFFTQSYMPNDPTEYSSPYGPFSSGPSDPYLNWIDLHHLDGQVGQVYEYFGNAASSNWRCPAWPGGQGGNTMPRFNGESAQTVGMAPSSQSPSQPNNEVNGQRVAADQLIFNQCGGTVFNAPGDFYQINSTAPIVSNTWYDSMTPTIVPFMTGLDPAAAPISMTLSGGCASGACSYAALGSSTHVRAVLVSATGNSSTGVSNAVTNPTITLTVPAGTYKWVNPATGAVLSSGTTPAGSNSFTYSGTFAGPSNPTDLYFQADQP
jgi:hypothetical protein